ncbi:hypothetical protein [Streptomyces erythrochromogenes]|uniref:hypothetical protein n=1 Tax=Streptomyces erythrochromogenes TaxID=285574 RepID=UPI0022599736|nr:hypothetical protein [Streptomyces erythrochromogenes]MCX5586042.1 hypothetical protein [Streptomyces erythrochromogenes]
MKFLTETRTRLVDRTIDGTTHQVPEPYTVRMPKLPRDKDSMALVGVSGLVLALTLVAIVWSTYSIGQLLGGGVGYAAGVVFDAAWLAVLLLEWLARFDPAKREFPRRVGWALALVAAGAIFLEGMLAGGWQMAAVGAAVSIVAKVLWWAVFKHIDKDLSPGDAAWVAAEMSNANAKLAIAGVRRQAAKAEVAARLELLAAERDLNEIAGLDHSRGANEVITAEQVREQANLVDVMHEVPAPLNRANTVREPVEQGPNISHLARVELTAGASKKDAVEAILAKVPDAKLASVEATVRRERNKLDSAGYR